jgi:hypothetical protein
MSDVAALYRELDPLRPLEGSEDALYVDWQRELDPGTTDARAVSDSTRPRSTCNH